MLSSRDQRGLETKFNGLVLCLVVLVFMQLNWSRGLEIRLAYAIVRNSDLKCQSDSTNRKLNSGR